MIDKEIFRKTEGRLYRYYRHLKEIEKLKYKVVILWNQKEQIENDIKETNVTIELDLNMGIDYSRERIQTSPTGSSYAEQEILKAIGNLEKELFNKKKKILKLHARIREIENQDTDMDYAIRMLGEVYKQFVLLKYKQKLSFEQIGRELHMSSKSTVSDWREKVVIDIAKLLYKNVE